MITVANLLVRYNKEIQIDYDSKYLKGSDKDNGYETTDNEINNCEDKLRGALREYRLNKSKEDNIKPYMVFNNETMECIINNRPKTREDILSIRGFGVVKCEKYGDDILAIICS